VEDLTGTTSEELEDCDEIFFRGRGTSGSRGITGTTGGIFFAGLPFLPLFSHLPVILLRTDPSLHFKTHLPVIGLISLLSGQKLEPFFIIHFLFRLKKIYNSIANLITIIHNIAKSSYYLLPFILFILFLYNR
jgi:hypothetical protein